MASPLAWERGEQTGPKEVQRDPIGYFHIDIAEAHTAEGRLYQFVAIDRTTKFAYAELHAKVMRAAIARDFLSRLIGAYLTPSHPAD